MLQLKDIKKDYQTAGTVVHALKGVSVEFRANEFVCILGASGCGKTTLLNIIGGLDRYTDGDLIINDKSTKEFRSRDWDAYRNRSVGFIFQSYNLIPHLNVLQNVELALTISGVSKKKKRKLATEALERVGLGGQLKKKPNQMSGGQMQRVAIARAIVNNPEIILADEPTGALDTKTSEQVMDLLQEIADDRLVIMVTHNPELAKRYSTRIIELMDGEVIADSNPYDGMPTILAPVTPMAEENVTPLEEYIAHSESEEEENGAVMAETALKEESKPESIETDKKQKGKKKKGKMSENPVIEEATATTDDAAPSALTMKDASVNEGQTEEGAAAKYAAEEGGNADAESAEPSPEDKFVAVLSPETPVKVKKHSGKPKREKKERTSMSFFTALSLSARNLITKRTRTFLTAFAGSIGIIGIALVLSLSNGFDLYMEDLEGSILSSMPLTVNSVGVDLDIDSLMNMEIQTGDGPQFPESDEVTPYKPSGLMGLEGIDFGVNVLTDEYMKYVQAIPDELPGTLNAIRYSYGVGIPLLIKTGEGNSNDDYTFIPPSNSSFLGDAMSSMGMSSNPIGWQKLLWDDFMLEQFTIEAGGYPGDEVANGILGQTYEDGEDYNGNKARSAVLVINSYNMIDYSILEALGIPLEEDGNGGYLPVNFDNILGTEITVVGNNNYYKVPSDAYVDGDPANGFVSADELFDENGSMKSNMQATYNQNFATYDEEENFTVTIVGVLRVKQGILAPLLQTGVAYTEDLVQLFLEDSMQSEIVKYQQTFTNVNVITGTPFSFNFDQIVSLIEGFGMSEREVVSEMVDMLTKLDLSTLPGDLGGMFNEGTTLESFLTAEQIDAMRNAGSISNLLKTVQNMKLQFGGMEIDLSEYLSDDALREMLPELNIDIGGFQLSGTSILALIDSSYEDMIKGLGGSDTPTGAYLYPTSFEAKDQICAYLDAWNEQYPGMSVQYTDSAGMISDLLSQVVDIVSYILIAFAAISLVVSSVMIAIITYVSVLERTTEIGVLRSIGARKLDVSNLFNAETAIIGATAGILGVFLAWIIDFPINAWIASLAPQAPTSFAVLNPLHALLLVALSIVLTVLSGLVPAIAAARKDPVKALRATG